ncbi:MAG: MFS transporter [Alphaproteobacteria bacterium]|nr:MFS transporter [Alphaproteobacteria bacterium]
MPYRRRGPGRIRGLFAVADFRRLWIVGLVVFAVRWLEMLAVGVFVYQHTGSAFAVASMVLLRLVPMALFGAFIGSAAERWDRRAALIVIVVIMMATSLSLALLAYMGRLAVWHLAVASFCNGVAWATDNPVRRVMIGEAVGPARMSGAMSIDVGANNASRMIGPMVGGALLAGAGIDGAFAVSVGLYAIALVAAWRVRTRRESAPAAPQPVLSRMIAGLSLVRHDRRLIGTLVVTVIYNLFGWPFTSMIPVIGQDSLHLGATGIGVLASMDGVGAFCGAVAMALWSRPALYLRLYVGGVAVYLVMVVGFALLPYALPAGAALLLTGLSSACFSIVQATLVYLCAPPEMRSRIYGVLSVCIGTGPLGFLYLGLMADAVGAPAATASIAIQGLIALVLTRRFWKAVGQSG